MPVKKEKLYTLKEAAEYLNVGLFNMRRLMREERVLGEKVQVGNLKKNHPGKWFIPESELIEYNATRGRKRDGKRVFQLRLSENEIAAVTKLLKAKGISIEPRYKRKS